MATALALEKARGDRTNILAPVKAEQRKSEWLTVGQSPGPQARCPAAMPLTRRLFR
jgi:hypothetical protein